MTPEAIVDAGLHLEVSDTVATVTLDRPEVRNAQTPAMWRAMAEIGAGLSPEIRIVVVRGAGESFSAGLDLRVLEPGESPEGAEPVSELLAMSDRQLSSTIDDFQHGFTWLRDPRFISIAAVQGFAIGAGFQLALACDLRVVTEDAQLCMREATLGLVPDLTGTKPLVESVGYARALEICVTARMVGALEAVDIGLALTAVPADRLDATIADLVAALTTPLAGAVSETKRLLLGAAGNTLEDQRRLEREAQGRRLRELAPHLSGAIEG